MNPKTFLKEIKWWKKKVFLVLVVFLLGIIAFLIYNWFSYSFIKMHTTQSDWGNYKTLIPFDVSKVPAGTDYIGTVEVYSYTKDVPIPVICGRCLFREESFGLQSTKTGECCYSIRESIVRYHFYQIIKIHTVAEKPVLEPETIMNLTVLKDLVPEDCENVNYNQNCYYELARKLRNPLLCNKIEHEGTKDICIIRAAINVKDCEVIKIQGLKQDCYRHLAINFKDIALCEKIKEEFWKESCKNVVLGGLEEGIYK